MTLDNTMRALDMEDEVARGNVKIVDDGTLRRTRGVLPFVLTVLEELGAPTPLPGEVQLAFLQYGKRDQAGEVYIPEPVPAEHLPDHFPTLLRFKELPDQYFSKPVGIYNAELGDTVQFSLLRPRDGRILIRCHYDLTQRKNMP